MRRLHPGSVVAELVRHLPQVIVLCIPIGFRLLAGEAFGWLDWLFVTIIVGFMVEPVFTYATQRYQISPSGLEHHVGLLRRSRRTIAWDAVTATEVAEPLIYRLCGIKDLTLSQGGDESTKIHLAGIDAVTLSEIQAYLAHDNVHEQDIGTKLYQASLGELMVMAVIRGQVILLGAAGLYSVYELVDETGLTDRVGGVLAALPVAGVVTAVLIGGIVVGIVSTVVTYYDFTVRLEDSTLVSSFGLFNRKERRIDPAVVRGVVVERNLIESWLGRARLGVLTRDSEVELATNTVLPTMPLPMVIHLGRTYFPQFITADTPLPERNRFWSSLGWALLLVGVPAGGILVGHWLGWLPWVVAAAPVSFLVLLILLRGLRASFMVDEDRGLVYIRRHFVGDRVISLRLNAVQIIRRLSTSSRGRYAVASISTFAGSPETYFWLRADRDRVETLNAAVFQ